MLPTEFFTIPCGLGNREVIFKKKKKCLKAVKDDTDRHQRMPTTQ